MATSKDWMKKMVQIMDPTAEVSFDPSKATHVTVEKQIVAGPNTAVKINIRTKKDDIKKYLSLSESILETGVADVSLLTDETPAIKINSETPNRYALIEGYYNLVGRKVSGSSIRQLRNDVGAVTGIIFESHKNGNHITVTTTTEAISGRQTPVSTYRIIKEGKIHSYGKIYSSLTEATSDFKQFLEECTILYNSVNERT